MLPFEILNVIMILVATSTHGARDLSRVRATCKLLKASVARSNVLRVVNFQCLTLIDNLRCIVIHMTSFSCVPELEMRLLSPFWGRLF